MPPHAPYDNGLLIALIFITSKICTRNFLAESISVCGAAVIVGCIMGPTVYHRHSSITRKGFAKSPTFLANRSLIFLSFFPLEQPTAAPQVAILGGSGSGSTGISAGSGTGSSCSFPGAPAHSTVQFTDDSLASGTVASYSCERGFELLGPARRVCDSGQWVPEGIPFCGKYRRMVFCTGFFGVVVRGGVSESLFDIS